MQALKALCPGEAKKEVVGVFPPADGSQQQFLKKQLLSRRYFLGETPQIAGGGENLYRKSNHHLWR